MMWYFLYILKNIKLSYKYCPYLFKIRKIVRDFLIKLQLILQILYQFTIDSKKRRRIKQKELSWIADAHKTWFFIKAEDKDLC